MPPLLTRVCRSKVLQSQNGCNSLEDVEERHLEDEKCTV